MIHIRFVIFFCLLALSAEAQLSKKAVRYDSQSLIIRGKREFIYSGAFHYFRCPKELWRKRFESIKAAGCNSVETYIPWNRHERQMPKNVNDFSKVDLSEFGEWLTMAESFGLYVIVRPGPFICAEYDRGGYPGWLTTLRPAQPKRWMWYRSDDPVYLKWAAHWMQAACRYVAPHQVDNRKPNTGGVILLQVENEFSHVYFPPSAKIAALRSLVQQTLKTGITVPLIACESPEISATSDTLIKNHVIETNNFYPNNNVNSIKGAIDALRLSQPHAPLMVTELQGGWFTYVWNEPTFKPQLDHYADGMGPDQLQNLALYCIQNGETVLNFYMLFGGTNLDGTASKDMQSSYDYSAPIRENGGTGEKYERVRLIGYFLKKYGEGLIKSVLVNSLKVANAHADVEVAERLSANGDRFIFIRNTNASESRSGELKMTDQQGPITVPYRLGRLGSTILILPKGAKKVEDGKWLPESGSTKKVTIPQTKIPVKLTQKRQVIPLGWRSLQAGQSLLQAGVYDNRYVHYRIEFRVADPGMINRGGVLRLTYPQLWFNALKSGHGMADHVTVMLAGRKLARDTSGLYGDFIIPAASLKMGRNEFQVLYENTGYAKEFIYMEKQAGIVSARVLSEKDVPAALKEWTVSTTDRTDVDPTSVPVTSELETKNILINSAQANGVDLHHRGIFKATVQISKEDIKNARTALWFAQVGDIASIFVNGNLVGRSTSRAESRLFDMGTTVHPGQNEITVVADNYDLYAKGGIGSVFLTYSASHGISPESIWLSTDTRRKKSDEKGGFSSMLDDYRYTFKVVPASNRTWILRFKNGDNSVIYLNGHAIGRYWKDGQQSDFYLPECWLKQKSGEKNEVRLLTECSTSNRKQIELEVWSFD